MEDCGESDGFLPLQQSAVYAGAVQRLGARVRWIDFGCGRALAVERGPLRMVMRGPVWRGDPAADDRRRALRQLARWTGVTMVTPEEHASGFGLIPLVTSMHHAIWPLGPCLRAQMAGNWRNGLARAERQGIQPGSGGAATLDLLLAAQAVQRRERRYRSLPDSFTRALPMACLRLWEWRQAGTLQAAMAFVRHGSSASYHLAWGSDIARAATVHPLMLTRAAEALWAEGVRWLDLGSVDCERAPGLARFKLGTGAALRKLGATMLVLP